MADKKKVEIKQKYKCSSEDLYPICRLGWDYYDPIQPKFKARSSIFTTQLSLDARIAIAAAEALPEKVVRQLVAKNALKEMVLLFPLVKEEWKYLEFYVRKAYPDTADAELEAAGYLHYKEATSDQWGSLESLVRLAKMYMTVHLAKLLEDDNMPVEFPDAFAALGDAFIKERSIRLLALGTSETGTTDKVVANNGIYDQLMEMLDIGKLINRNNATEYKKFVFNELKKTVRGRKPAGAKGIVKADGTFLPIANARFAARNLDPTSPHQSYTTTSDANGSFFLEMASGTYEIMVVAEGFMDFVVPSFKVKIGVKSRLYPVMVGVE